MPDWKDKWDDFSKKELREELEQEAFNRQAAHQALMNAHDDEPETEANPSYVDQADVKFYVPGQDNEIHKISIECTKHFVYSNLMNALKAMFPGIKSVSVAQRSVHNSQ